MIYYFMIYFMTCVYASVLTSNASICFEAFHIQMYSYFTLIKISL